MAEQFFQFGRNSQKTAFIKSQSADKLKNLTTNELVILVDALRSQSRLGHLSEQQKLEATRLLFMILKEVNSREGMANESESI